MPLGWISSIVSWYSPRGRYTFIRPRTITAWPSRRSNRTVRAVFRHKAQRIWASRSLSVRYTWPDDGRDTFDNSPSTHTSGKPSSSTSLTARLSSPTLSTFTSFGGNGDIMMSVSGDTHQQHRRVAVVTEGLESPGSAMAAADLPFRVTALPIELVHDTVEVLMGRG